MMIIMMMMVVAVVVVARVQLFSLVRYKASVPTGAGRSGGD
jgi:hypothetical protein